MKYNLKNQYKVQLADEYYKKLKEKNAYIEMKEIRLKRNLDQNALYWLWLTCIEVETGIDRHECHYLYRALYLPKPEGRIRQILQNELWNDIKKLIEQFRYFQGMCDIINVISKSTTELETDEFAEYLTKIQKHSRVNHDVILLNLKDKNFEDFYREYGFR